MSRKKVNSAITNEEERQKERKIERKKEITKDGQKESILMVCVSM